VRQAVLLTPDSVIHEAQLKGLLGGGSSPIESPAPLEVPVLQGQSLKKIAEGAAQEAEKQAIRNVLKITQGNKSKASKILKTDYKTLHLKIKKYGLGSPGI
jgi:DNA-binding NtrC family response regulator